MPFIGNQPALSYTSFAKQDFTTSVTTSYALSQPVANENEIALFINFVRQEPTTAYTASGTSLTLTSATSASDDMYAIFLGKAVQTVNPPVGSVGISQLSATGTPSASTFLRGDNSFATVVSGLTEADQWRLSTDLTGNQTITTNLERVDSNGSGYLGTGMTESSGVFTFPSTGYYLVTAHFRFVSSGTDNQQQGSIAVTIDNSAYNIVAAATVDAYTGSVLGTASTSYLFDVTSTTTHKVRFEVSTIDNQVTGNTSINYTFFTFVKLGDT
jgi:hypothetical protein